MCFFWGVFGCVCCVWFWLVLDVCWLFVECVGLELSSSSSTILRSITYTITGSAKNSGTIYIRRAGINKRKIVISMNTGRVRACRLPEGETECAD